MKKFAFLYGSQKSGTTWLGHNLKISPNVYNAGLKEWRLFQWFYSASRELKYIDSGKRKKDELRYQIRSEPHEFLRNQARIVNSDPAISVLADLTPSLGSFLSTENFRDLAGIFRGLQLEARGMMFMRDPVERTVSQLAMKVNNAKTGSLPTLEGWRLSEFNCPESEAIDRLVDRHLHKLIVRSRYRPVLEKINALDGTIPALVMTTDELFSTGGLDRVTGFLEIPEISVNPTPRNAGRPIAISLETRRKIARYLEPTYCYMEQYFGTIGFPKSWLPSVELLR